jgi:hypothetical protein
VTIGTEQEAFWQGTFGDDIWSATGDCAGLPPNTAFFANVLRGTVAIRSVLELGANIGRLHRLPDVDVRAIE